MASETPILDALIQAAQTTDVPLHVPGHKAGRLLPDRISQWFGNATQWDLTELPGLDNLQDPSGCIRDSERLLANAYGADVSMYSVNGSTAGVMASLAALTRPGDDVLFLNPFHKSAWQGLVLSGAKPVLLPSVLQPATFEFGFPSVQTVRSMMAAHPRIAAAFVTSPTYGGLVGDIAAFAEVLHAARIPLIVDEAHGAHLGFHEALPPHSVQAGADIVIQSAHKLLPALTQTAWVHCQGTLVAAGAVAEWLRMLQSTSPSYLLLASLDATQAWLREQGTAVIARGIGRLLESRADYPAFVSQDILRDPYKAWIPTGSPAQSRRLVEALAERGCVMEYMDGFGVLGVHRLDGPARDVSRFMAGLQAWAAAYDGPDPKLQRAAGRLADYRALSDVAISPREAMQAPRRSILLHDSVGCVLGRLITPYPPGVPIAFPGQIIDAGLVALVSDLIDAGTDIHGIAENGEVVVLEPMDFS